MHSHQGKYKLFYINHQSIKGLKGLKGIKMVACTFCRIKGLKHINSRCALRKWKKVREPPIMIRRSKTRIPELVMQRQSLMDARKKESRKR
jgi:hypothetical protein